MQVKRHADEKRKSIDILQSSEETLKQKISNPSARRETLLAELQQVSEMIKTLQQEHNIYACKALQMKKKVKPVDGSADEDIWEIEANQIRLCAISAIQALLNL